MNPRTKREYLRDLVAEKNRWSRRLTAEEKALGFLGWHERGYLPHCDFPGLVQFATLRLADSMPASRRGEWEHLLAIEDVREKRAKLEDCLDRGHGACHLRESSIARLVEEALLHFHNERCDLLAWCVMPNHVHVLVQVWQMPLWKRRCPRLPVKTNRVQTSHAPAKQKAKDKHETPISQPNPRSPVPQPGHPASAALRTIRLGAQLMLQKVVEFEVTEFLGRDHYQRSADGLLRGYRNGYEDKRVQTGEGPLHLKMPHVRNTIDAFESV